MNYRIIESTAGRIRVEYLQGVDVLATYDIDVPAVNGVPITGSALEAKIQSHAPTWMLQGTNHLTVIESKLVEATILNDSSLVEVL